MNNAELLSTSLDIDKVISQVSNENTIGRKRGRPEQERDIEITFEREINGMYKCPGCLMLYETKAALDTHWFGTCERVFEKVRERLGYTIGSSVDSELDSDSESEIDSETDSKTGDNKLLTTSTDVVSSPDENNYYEDIKCESCNQYFACFQQLDTHYFDFHTSFVQTPLMTSSGISLVTIPRNQKFKFKCPICFVSFGSASNIRNHLMDICMSTQKDKRCTKCLDCFADTEKLNDHIKSFHQPEIELECFNTGGTPSSSSSESSSSSINSTATIHNVIRDSKKKFKCPFCPCCFSSTAGIRHHTNTSCQWKELHIDDYQYHSRKRSRALH